MLLTVQHKPGRLPSRGWKNMLLMRRHGRIGVRRRPTRAYAAGLCLLRKNTRLRLPLFFFWLVLLWHSVHVLLDCVLDMCVCWW